MKNKNKTPKEKKEKKQEVKEKKSKKEKMVFCNNPILFD